MCRLVSTSRLLVSQFSAFCVFIFASLHLARDNPNQVTSEVLAKPPSPVVLAADAEASSAVTS